MRIIAWILALVLGAFTIGFLTAVLFDNPIGLYFALVGGFFWGRYGARKIIEAEGGRY